MINWFLRQKTSNIDSRLLQLVEVQQANKVLFSLFTRYGDTIINLMVIKEFIEQYPDKEYLILCPRQMEPYVNELLPNITCLPLNKRNIFDLMKANKLLKNWIPDIGFNPWSNGVESCFFLTYCKRFFCYKYFDKPKVINHYEVVRLYLGLKKTIWKINELCPNKKYEKVLICPESTDDRRSITLQSLDKILLKLQDYCPLQITIAAMNKVYEEESFSFFKFKKNEKSSNDFIRLVKQSDIVIAVDSAPLHIALAFNKKVIPIFRITEPKIVLNTGISYIKNL